ncbi:MAG: hypothetical protein ACYC6J_01615 [Coriobacteriia bacterium]
MSEIRESAAEAARIDGLYRRKALAEIAEAEAEVPAADGVRGQGDVLADVLLIKGAPGPDDVRTGRALSGEDGRAIGKALDALGLPSQRYAFCSKSTGPKVRAARRVRLFVEAVDPRIVVLLDTVAVSDFAAAFGVSRPPAGMRVRVGGRVVLALDDFAASLGDDDAKRRVWHQLQALRGG